MKTKIFRIIIGIVVVCAVLAAGVWFFQTRTTAQTTTDTSGFTQTVAVQQGDLNASISVVGELDATQSQDMAFDRLANSSTLLTLSVAAGNKVQAGQILAAVDPTPYQQALDQAQSALLEAQQNLEDLQTPPTESDIAQADLAIAKAKLDVETATAALTDLQAAPDLTDLETAVQSASDNLDLAKLQDSLAQHDSIAASERDLQYAVNYHQRLVQQLQDLVAQHKANLEQTDQLAEEQDTLAEVQAELAQVQAQHRLALQSSAAQVTAAEAELADPDFINLKGKKLVDMGVKISASTHLTESAFKAPGGMIRVHLLSNEDAIGDLMISGDFTCLPHEGVDQLSQALVGTALTQEAIAAAADKSFADLGIEIPGIEANDLATAIMMAAQPAE